MARTRAVRSFRLILHPSDFSPASRPAFAKALELAKGSHARLLVAHVLPILPMIPDVYVAAATYDERRREQRASGRKQLERLVWKARAAGVQASALVLDAGAPAERITRLARSRRADVIVMGTHGRSGLTRALLGSVAARVVATAACSVLTVRGARRR